MGVELVDGCCVAGTRSPDKSRRAPPRADAGGEKVIGGGCEGDDAGLSPVSYRLNVKVPAMRLVSIP